MILFQPKSLQRQRLISLGLELVSSSNGIRYDILNQKDKNQLLITQGVVNPTQATAVDRLIAYVSNSKTKSFIMLFAEKNSGLITIKQKKLSPNKAV